MLSVKVKDRISSYMVQDLVFQILSLTMISIQLIQLRLTSTIVKCAIQSIECKNNDDSLHECKKYHTRYYICNSVLILFKTILLPSLFYAHAYCTFAI